MAAGGLPSLSNCSPQRSFRCGCSSGFTFFYVRVEKASAVSTKGTETAISGIRFFFFPERGEHVE